MKFDAARGYHQQPSIETARLSIAEIKARLDFLGEAAARGLALKHTGSGYTCRCPFHNDRNPSFSIYQTESGEHRGHCFSCGWKGDVLDFIAEFDGRDLGDVIESYAAQWNGPNAPAPRVLRTVPKAADQQDEVEFLAFDPATAPAPDFEHPYLGKPVLGPWQWNDANGRLSFYTARYAKADGKKIVLPLALIRNKATGQPDWAFKWPKPQGGRPILWADDIAASRGESVVVVGEGEKVAEALRDAGFRATTWSAGTSNIAAADWSVLAGEDVLFCPDNDEPGRKAADEFRRLAQQAGVRSLRMLTIPAGKPKGWDLADESEDDRKALVERAFNGPLLITPRLDLSRKGIGRGRFRGKAPEQQYLATTLDGTKGFLPKAAPILVAGDPGVGKTSALFHLAYLVGSWDGRAPAPHWMGQPITRHGRAIFITGEDVEEELWRKLDDIEPDADREAIGDRVIVMSYVDDPELAGKAPFVAPHPDTGEPVPTEGFRELTEAMAAYDDIALVVIDPVGVFFKLDGNDYQDTYSAVSPIATLSAEHNCLAILSAHTNKAKGSGAGGKRTEAEHLASVMGSQGWVAAVRMAGVMYKFQPSEEAEIAAAIEDSAFNPVEDRQRYAGFQWMKSNIRNVLRSPLTLIREPSGLIDITRQLRAAKGEAKGELETALAEVIAKAAREDNPFTLNGEHNGYWPRLGELPEACRTMGKNEIKRVLEGMITRRLIVKSRMGSALPDTKPSRNPSYLDVPEGPLARADAALASQAKALGGFDVGDMDAFEAMKKSQGKE